MDNATIKHENYLYNITVDRNFVLIIIIYWVFRFCLTSFFYLGIFSLTMTLICKHTLHQLVFSFWFVWNLTKIDFKCPPFWNVCSVLYYHRVVIMNYTCITFHLCCINGFWAMNLYLNLLMQKGSKSHIFWNLELGAVNNSLRVNTYCS